MDIYGPPQFEVPPADPGVAETIMRRAQEEPMTLIFADWPRFDHPERILYTAKKAGRVVSQWLAVETAEREVVDDKDKGEK